MVYEFDILGPDSRLFEVEIDAVTGHVLDIGDDDDWAVAMRWVAAEDAEDDDAALVPRWHRGP